MPQVLTDDASTWQPQTAPVAGEPRTVNSVVDPLQRAANRVAYVKSKVDGVLDPNQTNAVRMLRYVDNRPALLALPASQRIDRMCVLVGTRGLYQFRATSTDNATPSPHVERPDDVLSSAAGRWLWAHPSTPLAYGPALLDLNGRIDGKTLAIADATSGRVNPENIYNGVMRFGSGQNPGPFSSSGSGNASAGGLITAANVVAGDVVDIDFEFTLDKQTTTGDVTVWVDVSGAATLQSYQRPFSVSGGHRLRFAYGAPTSGNYDHQLRFGTISTGTRSIKDINHTLQVVRP